MVLATVNVNSSESQHVAQLVKIYLLLCWFKHESRCFKDAINVEVSFIMKFLLGALATLEAKL